MIIAAYAGCGKTYWANTIPDSIDIPSMPFSRVLPDELSALEAEKEKAAFDHVSNPLYPFNYIKEIMIKESEYKYIIIPSAISVIEKLTEEFGREVIIVYPDINLKEEYRKRYIERGNSDDFFRIFIDNWDRMIKALDDLDGYNKIILHETEYLADVKCRIDDLYKSNCMSNNSCMKNYSYLNNISIINKIISKIKKNMYLWVMGMDEEYIYRIEDIDSVQTRKIIYDVGKYTYMKNGINAQIISKDMIKCISKYVYEVQSVEELYQKIYEN